MPNAIKLIDLLSELSDVDLSNVSDGQVLSFNFSTKTWGNKTIVLNNASELTTGTLSDDRLSANIPLKNAANTFTEPNTFTGSLTASSFSLPSHAEARLETGSQVNAIRFPGRLEVGRESAFGTTVNSDHWVSILGQALAGKNALFVRAGHAGSTAAIFRAAASATANITEWQNSAATTLFFINNLGGFKAANISAIGQVNPISNVLLGIGAMAATHKPLTLHAYSGQTANLLEINSWGSSEGNLFRVGPTGSVVAAGSGTFTLNQDASTPATVASFRNTFTGQDVDYFWRLTSTKGLQLLGSSGNSSFSLRSNANTEAMTVNMNTGATTVGPLTIRATNALGFNRNVFAMNGEGMSNWVLDNRASGAAATAPATTDYLWHFKTVGFWSGIAGAMRVSHYGTGPQLTLAGQADVGGRLELRGSGQQNDVVGRGADFYMRQNDTLPDSSTALFRLLNTSFTISTGKDGTATAPAISLSPGGTERARLTLTGNLLIGTITDDGTNKLQVAGGGAFTGIVTSNSSFRAGDYNLTNSGVVGPFVTNRSFDVRALGTGSLTFSTNSSERARFTADGHLLFTTSPPTYADNAAAVAGGLAVNTVYKTSTGELRIVV